MFYFAYGSNMSLEQMDKRCPGYRFISCAYLDNYVFVYDGYSKSRKGAVANLVASVGGRAWGGLFEISEANLAALDCYEGYPTRYQKSANFFVTDNLNKIYNDVISYYRTGEAIGEPTMEYRKVVLEGAVDCELPENYIQEYLAEKTGSLSK